LVVVAGLVLAAGCTNAPGTVPGGEPFFGQGTPRAAAPGNSNTLGPAAAAPGGGVPGLPANTSVTAPAALVSSTPPLTDAAHDLRAPDSLGAPGPKSSSWGPQGAAVLGGPQQESPSGDRLLAAPVRLASGNGAPAVGAAAAPVADSFEHLMEELHRRGATWWRLEPMVSGGKYRFVCSVPQPSNPNSGIRYDATSVGDNGLGAIRAVLDQIDRQRAAQ
jgi:hypothetical protein